MSAYHNHACVRTLRSKYSSTLTFVLCTSTCKLMCELLTASLHLQREKASARAPGQMPVRPINDQRCQQSVEKDEVQLFNTVKIFKRKN